MEMESESQPPSALTIYVHNKSWEDVTVTCSARPSFKLLDGNVVFFWFKWLASLFPATVRSGQKKKVNEITTMNAITHYLGRYSWRLYNIKVVRNGQEAICATPLDCTWVIEDGGIYQENDAENRCKFSPLLLSLDS